MGRKAGITLPDVVDAAAAIADRDGIEAASLSAVAARLGIKTPSLYNHVQGLGGLRRELALEATAELTAAFEEAARHHVGADRIRSIAHAYRRFARTHPGLYAALLPAPKPVEDEELYAAMAAPVQIVVAAIADVVVETDSDTTIQVIRALRAMLHGFVDLEANNGFGMPVDIDESFDAAVDLVVAAIGSLER
jgi:AcrR family transcriptional regulator